MLRRNTIIEYYNLSILNAGHIMAGNVREVRNADGISVGRK
jgi:hypothetical protein